MKKMISLFLLVILNAFTCAMALKASIGVGAYDALSQTFSNLLHIKVGTVGIVMNGICVFVEWIVLKKEFHIRHVLQIPVCFILGIGVNYVLYSLMTFSIEHYIFRIIMLVCAYIMMAIICGAIMTLDIVTFPLEGLCMACANKYDLDFAKIRQGVDIVCIIASLFISYFFHTDLVIREGTLIGMLMFAPILNKAMQKEKIVFMKLGMIEG